MREDRIFCGNMLESVIRMLEKDSMEMREDRILCVNTLESVIRMLVFIM